MSRHGITEVRLRMILLVSLYESLPLLLLGYDVVKEFKGKFD